MRRLRDRLIHRTLSARLIRSRLKVGAIRPGPIHGVHRLRRKNFVQTPRRHCKRPRRELRIWTRAIRPRRCFRIHHRLRKRQKLPPAVLHRSCNQAAEVTRSAIDERAPRAILVSRRKCYSRGVFSSNKWFPAHFATWPSPPTAQPARPFCVKDNALSEVASTDRQEFPQSLETSDPVGPTATK